MSILAKIGQYVKLPQWLQFVGVVLCFIALAAIKTPFWGWRGVALVSLGVASAGRLYNFIYP